MHTCNCTVKELWGITRHSLANWFKHPSLPSVSSPALSYVNWFYLSGSISHKAGLLEKKLTTEKQRYQMALFPQKLTSSAQPDASYTRFFLSCVDVCVRSEALTQLRAFAKSLIPHWVAQGDLLWLLNLTVAVYQGVQALSKNICCEYYLPLPAVFRVSMEILPQEQNFKLLLQSVSKSLCTYIFYFRKK